MLTLEQIREQYLSGVIDKKLMLKFMKLYIPELKKLYPNVVSINALIYLYLNDLLESVSFCTVGNTNRRFVNLNRGFMTYCGNQSTCKCNADNSKSKIASWTGEKRQSITAKRRATNLEKYGAEIASKTDGVKATAAATCIERYGTVSPTQNPEIYNKSKQTLLANWGVEYTRHNKEVNYHAAS